MMIYTRLFLYQRCVFINVFIFFQLQLSEVIMQARNYMMDIAGAKGNVLTHHKTIEDLQKYFAGLGNNPEVQTFLKNITSDKKGFVF